MLRFNLNFHRVSATNFELSKYILNLLAENPNKNYSLDELTGTVIAALHNKPVNFAPQIKDERNYQAKILDVLISLDNQGLIFLNSSTDQSCISHKGRTAGTCNGKAPKNNIVGDDRPEQYFATYRSYLNEDKKQKPSTIFLLV